MIEAMKIELAVGTKVTINGIPCKVKKAGERKKCLGCVFFYSELAKGCNEFVCSNKQRKDGKSVVLVKVSKSNAKADVKE
jgi:hypothetical protein